MTLSVVCGNVVDGFSECVHGDSVSLGYDSEIASHSVQRFFRTLVRIQVIEQPFDVKHSVERLFAEQVFLIRSCDRDTIRTSVPGPACRKPYSDRFLGPRFRSVVPAPTAIERRPTHGVHPGVNTEERSHRSTRKGEHGNGVSKRSGRFSGRSRGV